MILPILRLVLIYFLLVAGVVAVFNRDKLAPLLPGLRDRADATDARPAETPAPLAEAPAFDAAAASGAVGAVGTGDTGPVFPDPSDLETPAAPGGTGNETVAPAPQDSAAAAPVVTPAPGIAPEAPTVQVTPADHPSNAASTGETPAADAGPVFPDTPAAEAATAAPAQPAKPGSHAVLGTPVATATAPDPEPAAPAAAETPDAPAPAAPAAAPAELTAPAAESDTAAAPAAAADTGALAEALGAMRAAYWSGDLAGARAQAEALAAAHPDNPEIAGELGNLAFALRDYPAAADAWYRAGLILIERGEGARAMSFTPFLQSIDADKAADLAARLQER